MTPWTAARQASLSITSSRSLLKRMSIKLVMPSHHLILCFPLLLLPSIFPSIRVFPNESVRHIRWPNYWSFSFSISEYSRLISFRIDWFDLAVQGTLKSLLQHHSLKASVQFSQLCPTLCSPMRCSTSSFPIHHQIPELAQTHVHQVRETIQPSHPLSSSSPPAFSLPQHQGLSQ